MTKRFRIGNETMNAEMFDYNVLVTLNRLTRTGDWVSTFQVARMLYPRPNTHTFNNIAGALLREHDRGNVRRHVVRDTFPPYEHNEMWQIARITQ